MGLIISAVITIIFVVLIFSSENVEGGGEVKGYPASINCANVDCASYAVIHSQKEFEIRTYKNSVWIASVNVTTVSYALGYNAAYINAYVYYRGDNVGRLKWDKNTQPVITDIVPKTSFDSIYRVFLYVPNDYQNKTLPEPYEPNDVTAVRLPRKKFAAVARFDGRITDENIAAELARLKKSLVGTAWEAAAANTAYSVADYQFQLLAQENNRVNEVILWFD